MIEADSPAPLDGDPAGNRDPPGALGFAVVFDWALASQLLSQAGVGLLYPRFANRVLSAPLALLFALVFIALGEAMRRGMRPARWVQIALNAFLALDGIVLALTMATGGQQRRDLLSIGIMIGAGIWIVWRTLLPRTSRWFAAITPEQALRRHSGRWLAFVVPVSIGAGLVVATSQSFG